MTSIIYAQYASPAVYPPLMRSAGMLADEGSEVLFVGVDATGGAGQLRMEPRANVSEIAIPRPASRLLGRTAYLAFLRRGMREVRARRPHILYCSDLMSYPLGLWAAHWSGCKTVLHEHDPPGRASGALLAVRRHFARRAAVCVIPQEERAAAFRAETGARRLAVVYNCPRLGEVRGPRARTPGAPFVLWYHGSIGPKRLPESFVAALARMPGDVRLEVAGYETIGSVGYVARLRDLAATLGVSDRFVFHGALPMEALMAESAHAQLGVVALQVDFGMPMVGASVKPFDYLACGLPLLINRSREWQDFYGAEGVAVACDPADADDIARAVMGARDDPELLAEMARRGRELIVTRWNYEAQFEKVRVALGI